ncbi:MAG: glycogen debranching enzyme family protein [Acidobacteria bacterium]|nr:glycogen debranching enzyme family protein [Acidobacteriota bacterium]
MLRFASGVCADVERASRLEWLETNGIGGFASGTVAGLNTRRYHGLLTAATRPPLGRMLLLSKLEETLVVRGARYELGANRYPGVVHPQGYRYLREFRLDPCPVFVYEAGGARVEKRVYMVQGENTTVVEYDVAGDAVLQIRPLIAFRDYHATTHENGALNPAVEDRGGAVRLAPYQGVPPLYLVHGGASVGAGDGWYRNFEFDRERERGLDFREDLFNPLVFTFPGSGRIVASTEEHPAAAPRPRRPPPATFVEELAHAAEQFLVRRGDGRTVIAGYHWFGDWGRDTMIALPGLTLVTGRYQVARRILGEFARAMHRGMLPNRFPDAGDTPEYNTVDATLWFFEAVRAYARYSGDFAFVRDTLYGPLKDSIGWHERGTRYGIRVDGDGLLACGEPGVQLTWMDAKAGDWVVTPRHGKPVEIQALWYNALSIMEDFARRAGDDAFAERARDLASRAREAFRDQFWNAAAGCLYDVVGGGAAPDASLRPNQIFAASLPYSMLDAEQARAVVAAVERELLTPMGLRTLAPGDPKYRARYQGGVVERDSAYHQGTVWPWLMGPFVAAYIRVHGEAGRARAAAWLEGFRDAMRVYGLGQVPEIADGDAPHTPRGCIAQAWSVGELLRAAVECAGLPFGASR